jgi:hypothetical protein
VEARRDGNWRLAIEVARLLPPEQT